jgi:hypothetical protein
MRMKPMPDRVGKKGSEIEQNPVNIDLAQISFLTVATLESP